MLTIVGAIVFLFLLIQLPPVQTWLVRKAATILSNKLQTRVEIRSVNIAFFNKVVLKGVYVEGLTKDTLLYTDHISASINKLPIFGNQLTIGTLRLTDGEFNLKSDSTGANISKIIKNLTGSKSKQVDTIKKESNFELKIHGVELDNFRFTMQIFKDDSIATPPHTINFKDLVVDSIRLRADNIKIFNDTISFNTRRLSLKEKSGYHIRHLTAQSYILPGKEVHFDNFLLIDDYSRIQLKHYAMTYDEGKDFSDFVNKVTLSAEFDSTQLSLQSIGYFASSLQNIPLKAVVNGTINGTISNLKTNNIKIQALNNTIINGRFSITGLPDVNETIIFADLKQLRTSPRDVVNVLNKVTGEQNHSLNKLLSNINQINFKGSFTGLYNDFVANGNLSTNLGSVRLDVLFKSYDNKDISFEGKVNTPNFEVGKLLNSDIIGNTMFSLMVRGKFPKNGLPDVFSEGVINKLFFNNYLYENIKLSGTIKENEFNGFVNINDPNIDLTFAGKVNYKGTLTNSLPVFDFKADLRHIDFAKLNFYDHDSISIFEGKISANFTGNNISNFAGTLKLSDASYTDSESKANIGELSLIAQEQNGQNSLQLLSNYIDAQYIGPYKFGEFITELMHIGYIYMPTLKPILYTSNIQHKTNQRYELNITTKKPIKLATSKTSKLYIGDNSTIHLFVDTAHLAKVNANIKQIAFNNNKVDSLIIKAYNVPDSLLLQINSASAELAGIDFQHISIHNSIKNNNIATHIVYNGDNERKNAGDIYLNTHLKKYGKPKDNQVEVGIKFKPSTIVLNDSLWQITPATIKIDSSYIAINNLKLYKNNRYLSINGAISHNPHDTVTVLLNNYDLKDFNYLTKSIGYDFTGNLSGSAEITNVYNSPLLMINVNATDITVNRDTLGNITIASFWDEEYERLNIITRIFNSKEINANINGFFTPKTSALQFDMIMHKLKFKYIEPLLEGIVSKIEGDANGLLSLRGNIKDPAITGKINLNQTALTVDYLQTRYRVDAAIEIEKSKISIQNGTLYDLNNRKGTLNVTLNHNKFSNITFDAQASISNMLILNTKPSDNPLFYGTSYATGGIRISGNPKDIQFRILAQAEANSILYIPLPTTNEAKSTSMLSFKQTDTVRLNESVSIKPPKAKANINFFLDLTVTPATEIQILIDKKAGDILRAQGQGNLKINVNPSINSFDITGDYQIQKGDYNFTIPNFNIISRKFIIAEGSRIKFTGDVMGATLNMKATYRTRASLKPLLGNDPTRTQRRYTVDCQILITGKMAYPTLKLNIDFPNLDSELKAQIMSNINTEEKITTQFLSLLIASSFIPVQQQGYYNTASLLGNATDLLSGQIGSLISMLDLPIPLDVELDVGIGDNQQVSDFEFTGSTVLFDRVLINGSVGNNTQSNRDIVGDLELEVLLDKKGRYRAKVFTRSSDYFTNDLDVNMQGGGVSYQIDFDNFMDLLRRRKKDDDAKKETDKKPKKEVEDTPNKNNTTN